MKRLNEKTNEPFKMRDVRKDGYIFDCYITSVKQKNGYYKEMWRSPLGFKKRMRRKSERKKEINKIISDDLNKIKTDSGCAYCGYNENAVALDFHHINPKEKSVEVSRVWKTGWKQQEKARKEMEKCILLCAICHRIEEQKLRRETKCLI